MVALEADAVFPARAGMILNLDITSCGLYCIPRESGDDPSSYRIVS